MTNTKGVPMTDLEKALYAALITANQVIAEQDTLIGQLTAEMPDDLETVRYGLGQYDDAVKDMAAKKLPQIHAALDLAYAQETTPSRAAVAGLGELIWKLGIRAKHYDPATLQKLQKS